jgi:hypothetical protein
MNKKCNDECFSYNTYYNLLKSKINNNYNLEEVYRDLFNTILKGTKSTHTSKCSINSAVLLGNAKYNIYKEIDDELETIII